MVKLTEQERIEILCMVGFGARMCTQKEVVELFNENHPDRHPINQIMLRKEIWDDIKEYKEDYKRVIHHRESNRIPFHHQSPQFEYRKYLVTVLKKICTEKKLSQCCLHLATYVMDIFMDNHSIVQEKVLIVAMVCLLIAAKFEENSVTTPKIADLNTWIGNRYTVNDYKNLEILILRFFHWYVMFPTAAHYTHYYIQAILSMDDLKLNQNMRTLIFDLHNYIIIYLDKVIDVRVESKIQCSNVNLIHLQDKELRSNICLTFLKTESSLLPILSHNKPKVAVDGTAKWTIFNETQLVDVHYMQIYPPSKLAAAIIAASRMKVGLPSWTWELQSLTELSRLDIDEPLSILLEEEHIQCAKCAT